MVLPGRLRFALDAPQWGGGGVAFWDPAADGPGVLARAWRVTLRQYLEVVHLENGGTGAGARRRGRSRCSSTARPCSTTAGTAGWCSPGAVDGEPALTFTHPDPGRLVTPAAVRRGTPAWSAAAWWRPSAAPARGGLTAAEADAYLAAAYSEG